MPAHHDIANRAYDLYLKSGCKPGLCQQNWQQAEHELRCEDCQPGMGSADLGDIDDFQDPAV